MAAQLVTDKSLKHTNKRVRVLTAPETLQVPFWPLRAPLAEMESYDSTSFWLAGMNEATKKAYKTHLRLFCLFYSTSPDVLVQLPSEDLRILLDAYILYLLKVMASEAGKPKGGRVSVNSVGQYFTGLRSFFVDEHEKDLNWKRYEKKFPKRIKSNLRSYYLEEIQKMYKAADTFDKPLVLLEYCAWVRVGAIGALRFEHLTKIPEYPELQFLTVYPDSADESYPVLVTPEFLHDLEDLKELRQRWGEKITPKSLIFCPKFGPHSKRLKNPQPVTVESLRGRMRRLATVAGVDLTNIQPNHGMRKAGNTAAKNAHMDKDFKELLMGHSTGLDDVYYDIENPRSRRELVSEYLKAVDMLTISEENRLKRKVDSQNGLIEAASAIVRFYESHPELSKTQG